MVSEIIVAVAGPATGGLIAAIAGWWVAKRGRERTREERKKRWYMSVFRLVQEINVSIRTAEFMDLGTDQQRLVQQFGLLADQLDKERYRASLDVDSKMISAMANTTMYARRLKLDVPDIRLEVYHYEMLSNAKEIQYYIEKEIEEDLPRYFDQDEMEEVKNRIEIRQKMNQEEWEKEKRSRRNDDLKKQRQDLREKREQNLNRER